MRFKNLILFIELFRPNRALLTSLKLLTLLALLSLPFRDYRYPSITDTTLTTITCLYVNNDLKKQLKQIVKFAKF